MKLQKIIVSVIVIQLAWIPPIRAAVLQDAESPEEVMSAEDLLAQRSIAESERISVQLDGLIARFARADEPRTDNKLQSELSYVSDLVFDRKVIVEGQLERIGNPKSLFDVAGKYLEIASKLILLRSMSLHDIGKPWRTENLALVISAVQFEKIPVYANPRGLTDAREVFFPYSPSFSEDRTQVTLHWSQNKILELEALASSFRSRDRQAFLRRFQIAYLGFVMREIRYIDELLSHSNIVITRLPKLGRYFTRTIQGSQDLGRLYSEVSAAAHETLSRHVLDEDGPKVKLLELLPPFFDELTLTALKQLFDKSNFDSSLLIGKMKELRASTKIDEFLTQETFASTDIIGDIVSQPERALRPVQKIIVNAQAIRAGEIFGLLERSDLPEDLTTQLTAQPPEFYSRLFAILDNRAESYFDESKAAASTWIASASRFLVSSDEVVSSSPESRLHFDRRLVTGAKIVALIDSGHAAGLDDKFDISKILFAKIHGEEPGMVRAGFRYARSLFGGSSEKDSFPSALNLVQHLTQFGSPKSKIETALSENPDEPDINPYFLARTTYNRILLEHLERRKSSDPAATLPQDLMIDGLISPDNLSSFADDHVLTRNLPFQSRIDEVADRLGFERRTLSNPDDERSELESLIEIGEMLGFHTPRETAPSLGEILTPSERNHFYKMLRKDYLDPPILSVEIDDEPLHYWLAQDEIDHRRFINLALLKTRDNAIQTLERVATAKTPSELRFLMDDSEFLRTLLMIAPEFTEQAQEELRTLLDETFLEKHTYRLSHLLVGLSFAPLLLSDSPYFIREILKAPGRFWIVGGAFRLAGRGINWAATRIWGVRTLYQAGSKLAQISEITHAGTAHLVRHNLARALAAPLLVANYRHAKDVFKERKDFRDSRTAHGASIDRSPLIDRDQLKTKKTSLKISTIMLAVIGTVDAWLVLGGFSREISAALRKLKSALPNSAKSLAAQNPVRDISTREALIDRQAFETLGLDGPRWEEIDRALEILRERMKGSGASLHHRAKIEGAYSHLRARRQAGLTWRGEDAWRSLDPVHDNLAVIERELDRTRLYPREGGSQQ